VSEVGAILREIATALQAAAIPHMVVGSFASSAHGVPRTTMDLDLVIAPSADALDAFVRGLDPERFYVDVDADAARDALARRSMFNVIDMATAWKVDLIIRKDRPFSALELSRRAPRTIAEVEVPTASAEDTVIAKLEWSTLGGSERQLADIEGILRVVGSDLDLAYLERWIAELSLREVWERVRGALGAG
jgi:hypothetical protein